MANKKVSHRAASQQPTNVIQFPGSVMVRQADLAKEISIRTALMHQRDYIREILVKGGKVEPGLHSAKLTKAKWAQDGKMLEIK